MKYLFTITLLFSCLHLSAQDAAEWTPPSPESQAYHEYRFKNTVPPYGLAKIKQLVTAIAVDEEGPNKPPDNTYMALSLREKFTYHMIHAEVYSQNCDVMPPIQDEHLKVFGRLPDAFGENSWSERQLYFLRANRDSVMAIITESVTRSKRVGLNYKHAIVAINGKEMIPFLVSTYKADRKDHDILTVLLLLMKNNEYAPFMTSPSYRKLYGADEDYRAFIQYNSANEALILERATQFYNRR